jgi:hypothetical protein
MIACPERSIECISTIHRVKVIFLEDIIFPFIFNFLLGYLSLIFKDLNISKNLVLDGR